MFKKIWADPVWSKIIAVGIVGFIGIIYTSIQGLWPTILQWVLSESKISNWLLLVLCIVSMFSIFVVILRYQPKKMDANDVESDRLVYRKIQNILPWYDSISFIYEHDFYGNFDRDRLNDLYKFCDECKNPHFYFIDQELERMRNGLLRKIDQFLSLIAKKTYPVNNSNISEIPWEWKEVKPEEFTLVRENLNKFAQQIWESYNLILKTCRKKLSADE